MNLKFYVTFQYISRILLFQITFYLQISSNNQLICLKSEGQFILHSLVVTFDSYIDLMRQYELTRCDIVNCNRNSVAVREDFMKFFVYLFLCFIQFFHTQQK
jgi:hypothetical protein